MKMKVVIPIADNQRTFDVKTFRNAIHQTLGVDLSTNAKDVFEPIRAMTLLLGVEQLATQHIFKTFLILIPTTSVHLLFDFQNIKMSVTTDGLKTVAIATGSVDAWCNLITDQCHIDAPSYMLLILNQVQYYLEEDGIKEPFKSFNRVKTRDDNFYLG